MKKSLFFVCIFAGLFSFASFAQNTPITHSNYKLAERFSPEKLKQMVYTLEVTPNWLEHSNRFWYSFKTSEGTKWYLVDADRNSKQELFDTEKMAAELTRIMRDPYDAQHLPFETIRFTADEKAFRFEVKSSTEEEEITDRLTGKSKKEKKKYYFQYDLSTGKLTHLTDYKKSAGIPSWACVSPDGKYAVYAKDFNLYYMDRENLQKAMENEKDSTLVEHPLTTDGIRYFGYGSSRTNSADKEDETKEKRQRVAMAWSPDSKHFVVGKSDERQVKELWVIYHTANPRPTLETYKYQMPGEAEAPQYYLSICNWETKTMRPIDISAFKDQTAGVIYDKPHKTILDDYTIQSPVWLGSTDEFFFTRTSRDLKRVDICRVDVASLGVKPIIEERFNTYLETRNLKLPNGAGGDIIHWSEEDGWAHLYLYDYNGNRKAQITSGAYHVEQIIEIDPVAKVIYFTACGKEKDINPYYDHLYRVNFDGTGLRLLTPGDYFHKISMGERQKYFVDNYSRVNTVPTAALYDVNGRKVMQLETADLSRLMEAGYRFPEPYKVKAADGITDLYGVMYKPFDFDSTKLYPLIEYVYPGPQTEAVDYAFRRPADRTDRLAQLGFIVVTVGNRGGHPSRSKWYHTYGYGNLRDYGLADKKAAAIQLADRHDYIDINKVGIHGHSGGGFMSTAAILMYPDFFKVAVSCAGNHDNSVYNRWWSEKHHGVKEEINEKGDTVFQYSIAKNQDIAKNLKGKLLLVTGDVDNNVHPAGTIRVVEQLVKANKRFDMLVLPGQAHAFGNMTEYFFWRMADYYSEHLIGASEKSVHIPQMSE